MQPGSIQTGAVKSCSLNGTERYIRVQKNHQKWGSCVFSSNLILSKNHLSMRNPITLFLLTVYLSAHISFTSYSQKVPVEKDRSDLTGLTFPQKAFQDKKIFSVASAKTLLQMESDPYQVAVSDVEVFSFPNPDGKLDDARKLEDKVLDSIKNSGFEVFPSMNNPAFTWLSQESRLILMYLSSTRKETALYFGKVDHLPPFAEKKGNDTSTSLPTQNTPAPGVNPVNQSSYTFKMECQIS